MDNMSGQHLLLSSSTTLVANEAKIDYFKEVEFVLKAPYFRGKLWYKFAKGFTSLPCYCIDATPFVTKLRLDYDHDHIQGIDLFIELSSKLNHVPSLKIV